MCKHFVAWLYNTKSFMSTATMSSTSSSSLHGGDDEERVEGQVLDELQEWPPLTDPVAPGEVT